MSPSVYPLFSRYGVEIEYMIVSEESLGILPISDLLIQDAAGRPEAEVCFGEMCWNNELVRHVIEFKTARPAEKLEGLDSLFAREVERANALLKKHGASLLPTGMHPWMDPRKETRLWPHEGREIYERFHTLFDCFRHGWANLQSVHLNLPFQNDAEFKRLHAAIRVLLPILPALSASTPFVEGKKSGFVDYRMEVYRTNAVRVPLVTGLVIPDAVNSKGEYEERILKPIYKAMAPIDEEGVLQEEWVNARGAIARFDRNTIEIRVIDTQEHPTADLAILQAALHLLKKLSQEGRAEALNRLSTEELSTLFRGVIEKGESYEIALKPYLELFGESAPIQAKELWRNQLSDLLVAPSYQERLDLILNEGTLSTRLLRRFAKGESQRELYRAVKEALRSGEPFV